MNIEAFTRQYMETALWSSTDQNGDPLDYQCTIDDISSETRSQMTADCARFIADNMQLLNQVPAGYTSSDAGHDFWLTRCGHGAGFWDGDCAPVGDQLTEACKAFPNVDLYIGDDGKIYS